MVASKYKEEWGDGPQSWGSSWVWFVERYSHGMEDSSKNC